MFYSLLIARVFLNNLRSVFFVCALLLLPLVAFSQKDSVPSNDPIPQPAIVEFQEVIVIGKKEQRREIVSLPQTEIIGKELDRTRGASLGEALKNIPGVYTLQSGPSIFKPVIHGLHSNRILIINNGVRQEGQQWGSEHAPEIDPFVATKLSVIKGPASIRYGSDAIGGVILVEPAPLPTAVGVDGEVNLVGASNSKMGVSSGIVQGAFGKKLTGLSWRTQSTFRRAGNSETPHYYLENTGFKEIDFSETVSYVKKNYGVELYYSEFNTKLGIFSGTHAETLPDLIAAINRPRPITPSYFSYKIDRPYQQVKHEFFKVGAFLKLKNDNRIELQFARQHNVRSEYDYLPLTGQTNPELYLSLVTHSLDLTYKHKIKKNISGTVGFNGISQGNVRKYQLLIPNFRNYGAGIFMIEKWTKNRLTIEAGIRYDYRWLRAYMLDNTTAKEITPTFQFKNFTETVGALYHLTEIISWSINAGTAWRAPTVNELLSNGVHQSAVSYEIGNANLKSERAYNFSTSINYQGKKISGEIGFYNNSINGYIYLKPDLTFIHTIRGAYPAYTYTQVKAIFRGVDFSATCKISNSFSITSKLSLLFARNTTILDYLILVPANRLENILKYALGDKGKLKQACVSISTLFVAKQTRVPANSDYASPPVGYTLLNADLWFSILVKQQHISISMSATNILNVAYRDYMDRFRYFNDEPGRNFTLRLKIPFEIFKKNNEQQ